MAFTYDLTNDVGKVRMKIRDMDFTKTTGPRDTWSCFWNDEEVQAAIDEAGSLNYAAAALLDAMVASPYFLKNTTSLGAWGGDIATAIKAMTDLADRYRKDVAAGEPYMATAELAVTDFNRRVIEENEELREVT